MRLICIEICVIYADASNQARMLAVLINALTQSARTVITAADLEKPMSATPSHFSEEKNLSPTIPVRISEKQIILPKLRSSPIIRMP